MDPLTAAFGAMILAITALLLIAYLKFVKMNVEIRRARLFIMSKRINRFLLASTIGWVAISVVFLVSTVGIALPRAATTLALFVWLGAVLFSSVDLFFVAAPRARVAKSASPGEAR